MNTSVNIELSHSECRPKEQAWRASSGGHTTYASSEEEALKKHRELLDIYRKIDSSIKDCAALCNAV